MSRLVFLTNGIWYWADPDQGRPLALASIYVGVAGTDPEVEANRINVTIVQEDGTEVVILPADQPLRTGGGGVVMYQGSPVTVQIDVATADSYAVKVLDSVGVQKYYAPSVADLGDDEFVRISGDTMTGHLKQPDNPVDDDDYARKGYVDNVVGATLLDLYPVGSYFLGLDPAPIIGGTWEPVPEGTFLMSTIGGADVSGGTNAQTLTKAQMPVHNHGGGNHSHWYYSAYTGNPAFGSGNDISFMGANVYGNRLQNFAKRNRTEYTANVANDGSGQSFNNRPQYIGIPIYKRIL